jgi:hypothetical protein
MTKRLIRDMALSSIERRPRRRETVEIMPPPTNYCPESLGDTVI